MPANRPSRLVQLQTQIPAKSAYLLTTPTDIEYFSGFELLVPEEREAFLVVTQNHAYLLHASFSPAPANPGLTLLAGVHVTQLASHLQQIRSWSAFDQLYIDKTRLFADEYEALQQLAEIHLLAIDRQQIWLQRSIKDSDEILAMTQAAQISSQALARIKSEIQPGVTEIAVQRRLDAIMVELGSDKPAFPTIVAFGSNGALPHHQPTDRMLQPNTAILLDFGATYQHYRSDMTRSWWFGDQPPADFTQIKNLVDEAYSLTLEQLHQTSITVTAQILDETARTFISQAGFGQEFIHTTGHGVGLDIHEPPSLYWKNKQPLLPGMIITIEPGIYLPERFGYRWENTVLITDTGCQELTK